jgi:hypothetical protein
MIGGPGLRFALEALFLVALAVAAGLAELGPTTIVLVMGAAWLLVAVIEWLAWREGPRVARAAPLSPVERPAVEPALAEPAPRRRRLWRRESPEPPEAAPAPVGEDTQDFVPPADSAPVHVDERTGT